MDIKEATKIAVAESKGITRASFPKGSYIIPTNTSECCIIHENESRNCAPRWEPNAKDLLADDWDVYQ